MNTGINRRIAVGAGWMVSIRWVDRLIGLVSIAILARLLLPADFGLLGYAMVFLGTLDQLSMFNFQMVLIRDQDAPAERYNTAWTLEIIKGLVLSIVLVVSAESVADFFNEPRVEGILYWIAVVPIVRGLVNIGIVDFQKDLELHKVFYLNVIVRFVGTITTLVLALVLRNYWALVYGQITQAVLRVVLSYVMSNFRPRLCLSETTRIFGFSKWVLAQNICASINIQLPVIVIGRFFGAQTLAFFNMAKELAYLITVQFAAPIRHALYPGLSKMQGDNSQMENTVLTTLGIVVLLGLPATIGIGVTAPLLIPAFLGDKWVEVAPVVTVLSLSAAISVFYPNSSVIFYVLNRPEVTAYITLSRLCFLVPAILFIVPKFGVLGAAWTLVATSGFGIIVDYLVLFRMTRITSPRVISIVWRSTLAVIIMAICVAFIIENPFTAAIQESKILHLATSVAAGVASYVTAVAILWSFSGFPEGAEIYVIRMLKTIYNRRPLVGPRNRELS